MNPISPNLKNQNRPIPLNNKDSFVSSGDIKTNDAANRQTQEMPNKLKPLQIIRQDNKNRPNDSLGEKIKSFLKFKNTPQIKSRPNAPSSQKLELLTEEIAGVKISNKILFTLIITFIGSLILVFGLAVLLSMFGQTLKIKIDNLQNRITGMRQKITQNAATKEKSVSEVAEQVEAIYTIVAGRAPWLDILNNLETYTLPSVYYQGLILDDSGKYTFSAQAESFADIINQVEIYKSIPYFIKNVEVSNLKMITVEQEDGKEPATLETENIISEQPAQLDQYVEFNLLLEIAPEFFPSRTNSNQPASGNSVLIEPTAGNQDMEF